MMKEKIDSIIKLIVLPALIVIYCFWDVNRGVDLSDTGYNIERFYNFLDCSGETVLSTFWSNCIGYYITKLPGATTWLGMMSYCTLIILLIALIAYFFCINFLNCYVVFTCEIISLALFWIPASVLYDSLTFLLLEITIVLLYVAIKRDKNLFFICAGIVLGINTFVRISNVVEILLIILIWYYAWKKRNELAVTNRVPWVIFKTCLCIIGYVIGIIISVCSSLRFYDVDTYIKVFFQLSGNTGVEGYGLGEMAFGTLNYIFSHSGYLLLFGLIMAVSYIGNTFIATREISENKKVWLYRMADILEIFVTLVVIWIIYNKLELFTTDYNQYSSIKGIMALVYLWGIFVGIINVIYKHTTENVMAFLLYLIILWTVPLGSNNQIYLDISNSFLLLPIICYLTNGLVEKVRENENAGRILRSFWGGIFPVVGLVIIQTLLFGGYFVFGDRDINSEFETKNILYGMQTLDEKKNALESLIEFIENTNVKSESVLQYCDSPGLIYVLQAKRGIERSWPELETYPLQSFEDELAKVERKGNFPLIILSDELAEFYDVIYGESEVYIENEDIYRADMKVRVLLSFINNNGYKEVYDDDSMYVVFAAE